MPAISLYQVKKVRRGLMQEGFRPKRAYSGVKVLKVTTYSWTTKWGTGSFNAYVCSYPKYENQINRITTSISEKGGYYEDTLDEVLGGQKETLGG